MLQVTLAPAAVALREVDQRRRQLLVASRKVDREPHRPDVLAQQRGLDEVVAQNVTAEQFASGLPWQCAMLDEGLEPDDRVVAPVIALAQLPVVEAGLEDRAIEPEGKLQRAGEERPGANHARRAFDEAG